MVKILYIMCGVGFSGKSTLAKQIAEHTGAVLVSQDALFFEKEKELNLDQDSDEKWRMILAVWFVEIKTKEKFGDRWTPQRQTRIPRPSNPRARGANRKRKCLGLQTKHRFKRVP